MTLKDQTAHDPDISGGAGPAQNRELWDRINSETEMLRRRTTPIHVQQRILSSLPDEAPLKGPTARFKARPLTYILGAVALLIAGVAVGMGLN